MATDSSNERAVLIARSVLAGIRDLNAQGKGVGIDEISQLIQSDPDMADILIPATHLEKFQKNELLRQKKELEALREELRKNVTKRRSLVAQADAAERQAAKTKEFMHRAFLTLMPHLSSGKNRKLKNTFSRIRDLLKRKAPIHELDTVFQQLKEDSLKGELETQGEASPDKKPSGPASGEQPPLGRFRDKYLKLIDGLKSLLDHTGLKEISEIEERLRSVLDAYDLLEIQNELKKLLKAYVHRVGLEREDVAEFILEIGERLAEIETKILLCSTSLRETGEAGVRFTSAIEEEMRLMQDAVDITKGLDELKTRVMGSIGHIKTAIEKKRKDEWNHAQQSEEQMSLLTENIKRMKLEIASAKKRAKQLETEILLDPLTKTHSRKAYELRCEKELKRYREEMRVFSILYLDVDNFKEINERYGHDVGDICLKGLAQRINPLLRDQDFLARFEGDAFVIVLPDVLGPGARKAGEKIRAHIEKTNFLHKKEQVKVTISIGVAEIGPEDQSVGDLFGRVEKALYRAKEDGRNRTALV